MSTSAFKPLSKRVHFAPTAMAYDAPKTPSPSRSASSLPDSPEPRTPPSVHYHIPLPSSSHVINPILAYQTHSSTPSLFYDVTLPPECASLSTSHRTPLDRAQSASEPGMEQMEIQIPSLSCWRPIQIVAQNPKIGITVGEVIDAIDRYLRQSVTKREYETFPGTAQNKISAAFHGRCESLHANPELRNAAMEKGLIRVDCLAGHVQFRGLVQVGKSSQIWQLQLSPKRT